MHGMHSEWDSVRKEQRYEMETKCYSNCVYSLPTDFDKENERKKKTEEARINQGEENTDCDSCHLSWVV